MTDTATTRRRAPAMSPEERRATVIRAAIPLLAEHGMKVTTSQIAAAAGIAEGTVFRVFADKTELVEACLHEVMRPEEGLDFVASIPRDLPLAERLALVANHMRDRMHRISTLMHALLATGHRPERMHGHAPADREKWLRETTDALVDLIGTDAAALRLPSRRIAGWFLGLVFSTTFASRMKGCNGPAEEADEIDRVDIDELIDVFLHGVLRDTSTTRGNQ